MSLKKYFKDIKDVDHIKVYTKEAIDALECAKERGLNVSDTIDSINRLCHRPINMRLVSEEELMLLGVKDVSLSEYPIPYVPFTSNDLIEVIYEAEDINDTIRTDALVNLYTGDRTILQNVFDMFEDGMELNLRGYVADELCHICAYGGDN
ncbi:MAG: hypothetical protein ACRC92_26470 [Peptostreptococcaceae bacterium]